MELKSKRDRLQVGLLLLPGLLVFALFTIYPIVKLLYMSFLQWDLGSMLHQKFIGLQNYIDVLSDETFRIAFANTLLYTLATVPGQMILGLLAAVLINAIPRFRVTFRVIYYIPVITSWVIVSLIFRYIFNTEGMLNYCLRRRRGLIHSCKRHDISVPKRSADEPDATSSAWDCLK